MRLVGWVMLVTYGTGIAFSLAIGLLNALGLHTGFPPFLIMRQ